jgi:prevent-host-death family protein
VNHVGAYQAKTHLAELLDRVEAGETIVITRHGRPVAQMTSPEPPGRLSVDQAIVELRAFRDRHPLPHESSIRRLLMGNREP